MDKNKHFKSKILKLWFGYKDQTFSVLFELYDKSKYLQDNFKIELISHTVDEDIKLIIPALNKTINLYCRMIDKLGNPYATIFYENKKFKLNLDQSNSLHELEIFFAFIYNDLCLNKNEKVEANIEIKNLDLA